MKNVGALGTVFDAEGRVLLVHQTYAGTKWVWPGGSAKEGEAPWAAAVREVREETGLEIEVVRLVSVYYFADRDALGFQFLCRRVGGELQADGREISEAQFFDPAHLPAPMTKNGRQRLADALANVDRPFLRVVERVEIVRSATVAEG